MEWVNSMLNSNNGRKWGFRAAAQGELSENDKMKRGPFIPLQYMQESTCWPRGTLTEFRRYEPKIDSEEPNLRLLFAYPYINCREASYIESGFIYTSQDGAKLEPIRYRYPIESEVRMALSDC
jgi:hypothetical protein